MKNDVLAGLTVLVVEDEYLIALEAQRIAEEAGAGEILLANSVAEVRKLLTDGPKIDVAVLDLGLGKEDASPLIEEFGKCGIALLVTTGFDGGGPEVRLSKPYRDTELVAAIRRLLGKA
jgi:DNA-binding response OmpR family regulator